MSVFLKFKSKKAKMLEARRRRLVDLTPEERKKIYVYRSIGSLLFFVALACISIILFFGQSPLALSLAPNQISTIRLIANFDFSYESETRTEQIKKEKRKSVLPVYSIDLSSFKKFSKKIEFFRERLALIYDNLKENKKSSEVKALEKELINDLKVQHKINLRKKDLAAFIKLGDAVQCDRILSEGLFILQEVAQKGIFEESDFSTYQQPYILNLDAQDQSEFVRVQSRGNALRFLRMNLWAMDIPYEVASALIHLLKEGIVHNLVYDKAKTEEKMRSILDKIQPFKINVHQGELIVDVGQKVTPDVYEKFIFYNKELSLKKHATFHSEFFKKVFLAFWLLLFALLYLYFVPTKIKKSKRCLLITTIIVVLNLVIIRLVFSLCNAYLLGKNMDLFSLLPYILPFALGSILITVLMDPRAGMLVAMLTCALNAIMQDAGFDYFIGTLLSSFVAIYFCRYVRVREKIVRAGIFSGIVFAMFAFSNLIWLEDYPLQLVFKEAIVAELNCFVCAIVAIGALPLFEKLFRYTTDITLLELTDYNHPLLRKLQLVAPGTYHHSLMVASLAERAAVEVGANPLLARCCALYHDIGKIVKPEYFTENQKDSVKNPHYSQTPSMSALILKNHVKEGVEIVKSFQLPKVIADIIRQHHGTSLMQYFYQKALRQSLEKDSNSVSSNGTAGEKAENYTYIESEDSVDEATFRYEGPKPQFKESAIISLADSVEAASRSLKKVNSQNILELIDGIMKDRIEDEQLNECNITLKDLSRIKNSFCVTLLNMLHSRVSYPKKTSSS